MAELSVEQQRAVALARARQRQATQSAVPTDYRGEGGGRGTGLEAALIGARQGVTLGFGDEINAGVRAVGDMIGGQPFGEAYDKRLEHERGLLSQTRQENPYTTFGGEMAGSVALPGGAVRGAQTAAGAAGRAALGGGAFGAAYGAGEAEGGAAERAQGAAAGAALGGLFGAGANVAANVGTKAYRSITGRVAQRPSVEGLKAAKSVAYKAVDDAGEVFPQGEMAGLTDRVRAALDDLDYVPETDTQTKAALTILEKRMAAGPQTLGQLDKVRQGLWERYNKSGEKGVMAAIEEIDDLIASRASTNDLMLAARHAHSQYKKAELLEHAMKRAQDQTSATGSGGNILNKYRQAVEKIMNNPKQAKWFNEQERATMQRVVDGTLPENIMRRMGKLSPSGNGLMLFLNLLGGAQFGPEFLAVTAAGVGAKEMADRSGERAVQGLLDQVSGAAPKPPPVSSPGWLNRLAGQTGG